MLFQISTLPLQHQSELKKALAGRVPNIDVLVAAASKAEVNQSINFVSDGSLFLFLALIILGIATLRKLLLLII